MTDQFPTTHVPEDMESRQADAGANVSQETTGSVPDDPTPDNTTPAEDERPANAGQAGSSDTASGDAGDGVPGEGDYLPPGQTELPVADEVVIDDETMRRALEAILMVTDEPLPVLTLARAVGRPTTDVATALESLAAEYIAHGRGFDLRQVGGGWRYYTHPEAAPYVERFVLDGQQSRLTQAALETLAVISYKQPVSRARVSAIRGVNVDGVVRTLIARGLVEEAGADTESQATLYRTTSYFLERMGMQSLDDLPELAPYLPDMDDIEEELAAHSLPLAAAEAGTAEQGTTNDTIDEPQSADPMPQAERTDGEETTERQAAAAEQLADGDDESAEKPAAEGAQAGESGIDGDLTAGGPAGLDLDHKAGDLEPSDEIEPADAAEPTDAAEPADVAEPADDVDGGDDERDG